MYMCESKYLNLLNVFLLVSVNQKSCDNTLIVESAIILWISLSKI